MATKPLPDQELLEQLFSYEPETGTLRWRPRSEGMFSDGEWNSSYRKFRSWNAKHAGKEAFCGANGTGYKSGRIFGATYVAHRVIWKLVNGTDPDCIDHINGIRTDNRILNLRSVSKRENSLNQRRRTTNLSGACGVCWYAKLNKWMAKIRVRQVDIHLGYFEDFEAAVTARKDAEKRYGFHHNHGSNPVN